MTKQHKSCKLNFKTSKEQTYDRPTEITQGNVLNEAEIHAKPTQVVEALILLIHELN